MKDIPSTVHFSVNQLIEMAKKEKTDINNSTAAEEKRIEAEEKRIEAEGIEPDGLNDELVCGIEDVPPWYLTLLLALQHFLMMYGSTISIPFILVPFLCTHGDQSVLVGLISTMSFVAGIATILQTTIGIRLPIVQGGTFTFLVPTIAILSLPKWSCPALDGDQQNVTLVNSTSASPDDYEDIDWKVRIREIQGAIMFAACAKVLILPTGFLGLILFLGKLSENYTKIQGAIMVAACAEVLIPLTGVLGLILRYVGPLTIAPTLTLIGVALFEAAANYSSKQWYIAITTMVLITIFSQYLKNVSYTAKMDKLIDGQRVRAETKIPVFALFPILIAMIASWIICVILTETNVFPNDPTKWGYGARTDINAYLIREASWFRVPYPGQWGRPTVSVGAVFGMLAGVLASMIESVGDYYACAELCELPPPPPHAINRGLFIEGCASILAGAWGTGNSTTSYSQNVGSIGLTKVASRRVVQVCGFLLLVSGCILKFSALFACLPEPVLGGALMILFGMIVTVGLSNLQHVNIASSRTSFIVGTSFFFGLSFPFWMGKYGNIDTGVAVLDQIFTVICSTNMFVGGLIGFILDNTIPGTPAERGLVSWHSGGEEGSTDAGAFDIPYVQESIDNSCLRFIPILSNHRDPKKTESDEESINP